MSSLVGLLPIVCMMTFLHQWCDHFDGGRDQSVPHTDAGKEIKWSQKVLVIASVEACDPCSNESVSYYAAVDWGNQAIILWPVLVDWSHSWDAKLSGSHAKESFSANLLVFPSYQQWGCLAKEPSLPWQGSQSQILVGPTYSTLAAILCTKEIALCWREYGCIQGSNQLDAIHAL